MSRGGRSLFGLLALAAALAPGCGDDHGGAGGAGGGSAGAGGCFAESAVPNEGWVHIPLDSPVTYRHNPPASGPHYPIWAAYQVFTAVVPRGYWVHNLEHGAIVLVYRPDAPAEVVAALKDAYEAIPDDPEGGHKRALLTADPLLDDLVAASVANFTLEGGCVDRAAILAFVAAHRNHAPEDICSPGRTF